MQQLHGCYNDYGEEAEVGETPPPLDLITVAGQTRVDSIRKRAIDLDFRAGILGRIPSIGAQMAGIRGRYIGEESTRCGQT